MGIEGFSNKIVNKNESQRKFADEMFDNAGFEEIIPAEEETDTQEATGEYQQTVSNRLEARAFSKEHSQFYRARLAGKILNDRRWLREKLSKNNREISNALEHKEGVIAQIDDSINRNEKEKERRLDYIKKFDEFKNEVAELESAIEHIKNSFWRKLFSREKLSELEARRQKLSYEEDSMYEPDRKKVQELSFEIERYRNQLEEELNSPKTDQRVAEIKSDSFFFQDDVVSRSKSAIKEFYKKNLDLKHELDDDPMSRDVAENCREHGVLLRHGVPNPDPRAMDLFTDSSYENNTVVDSRKLNPAQRLLFAAAIQPALSTHTANMFKQGLIVGGGEVTLAYESDAYTKASDFDSRNAKYDKDAASSLMPNIREEFAGAVKNVGRFGNERPQNEIVVKHPEFSAVYIEDDGKYGKYSEEGHNEFYRQAKWSLEQAAALGMPAVVILESGQIINIATDEEVTHEELLSKTVQHSPAERSQMFEAADRQSVLQGKNDTASQEQVETRLDTFAEEFSEDPEMEHYKQVNRELAQAKLDILEAEKIEANHKVREMWGTAGTE